MLGTMHIPTFKNVCVNSTVSQYNMPYYRVLPYATMIMTNNLHMDTNIPSGVIKGEKRQNGLLLSTAIKSREKIVI